MGNEQSSNNVKLTDAQIEAVTSLVKSEQLTPLFDRENIKVTVPIISETTLTQLRALLALPTEIISGQHVDAETNKFKPIRLRMSDCIESERFVVSRLLGYLGYSCVDWEEENNGDNTTKQTTDHALFFNKTSNRVFDIGREAAKHYSIPTREEYLAHMQMLRDGSDEDSQARFEKFWANALQQLSVNQCGVVENPEKPGIFQYAITDNNLVKLSNKDQARFDTLRTHLRTLGFDINRHKGFEQTLPNSYSVYIVDNQPPDDSDNKKSHRCCANHGSDSDSDSDDDEAETSPKVEEVKDDASSEMQIKSEPATDVIETTTSSM